MMKVLERHWEEYIGCHADLIYTTNGKIIRYWKMGQGKITNGWMPGHPTLFLKRSVYQKYGLYKTNYKCSADYELMVRILKDSDNQLCYVPEIIVNMSYGGTSTSGISAYLTSLREGHRALQENGIKNAWAIDIKRTWRFLGQFNRKKIKKLELGKRWT